MNHDDIETRVEILERKLAVLREEMRSEIKRAAHELRQDSDFARPYWRDGADQITDHLFTQASRKLLWVVLGALGSALLLWAGSKGAFWQ